MCFFFAIILIDEQFYELYNKETLFYIIIMATIVSAFVTNINSRSDRNMEKYIEYGKQLLQIKTPKVIFIDEISLDNKKGKIKMWTNNHRFRKFKFLFVLIMSIITGIILMPFLSIKFFSGKLARLI